jgi:hypothetical protein
MSETTIQANKTTSTTREQLRRAETSSLLFAMQLSRIQPAHGCDINLSSLARLLDQYASRENFGEATEPPGDGKWAEAATVESKCSAVCESEKLGLRLESLEALEDAFNAIHYNVWWRMDHLDELQVELQGEPGGEIENGTLAAICCEVEDELSRLAGLLGIWINWMKDDDDGDDGDPPKPKPSNYWKDHLAGTE